MHSGHVKALVFAGAVGIGVLVAARLYYAHKQRKKRDETDEGIGDEDSIISDSEESPIQWDPKTPITIAPKVGEKTQNSFQYNEQAATAAESQGNARTRPKSAGPKVDEDGDIAQSVQGDTDSVNAEKTYARTESEKSSDDGQENEKKVLILGLDQAGKTALVETLTKHHDRNPDDYRPTNGFNVAQARCDGVSLNIMEVGGGSSLRKYWPNFLQNTDLLVYVLDGSDHDRFDEAKGCLSEILAEEALKNVPCLLLANKQDIVGSSPSDKIISEKDLAKLSSSGHFKFTLLDSICIPRSGDSIDEYADMLMAVILNLLE